MTDNARKTPIQWSLNEFASGKVDDGIQNLGKGLPCSVVAIVSSCIVTVKFEVSSVYNLPQITVPVGTPEYIRLPIQVGDLGRVVPSDYYLGGVSGLGGGTADLVRRGNLATLVFHPVSSTGWAAVDLNALDLNGPNGCVIRDTGNKTTITVTPTGIVITLQSGDNVTINGDLHVTGEIVRGFGGADQVDLGQHTHSVQTGSGHTGKPDPGT